MATVKKHKERTSGWSLPSRLRLFFALLFLLLSWFHVNLRRRSAVGSLLDADSRARVMSIDDGDENAAAVKAWRKRVEEECRAAQTEGEMSDVKTLVTEKGFVSPSLRKEIDYSEETRAPRRCRNVVIDFGANVGDSVGKIVDGGLPGCDKKDLERGATRRKSLAEPNFLQGEERIDSGNWNGVSKYFREIATNAGPLPQDGTTRRGPEDYCMYGVEGNPTFTEGLRKVEQYVMSLKPRPLRHLHIFTETVGAATDAPTEIFLDTVNDDKNFWGSSIIASHRDVQKGAKGQDSGKTAPKMVAKQVNGISLTTLMKKTLTAFAPSDWVADADRANGHLFLKIDIEGGEYQLINEAFDSGVLCEYVSMGNSVDILVEFHTENLIGKNDDLRRYHGEVKEKLKECGVNIKRLPGGWA